MFPGVWVALLSEGPFKDPFCKGAVLFGDLERDPDLENNPFMRCLGC